MKKWLPLTKKLTLDYNAMHLSVFNNIIEHVPFSRDIAEDKRWTKSASRAFQSTQKTTVCFSISSRDCVLGTKRKDIHSHQSLYPKKLALLDILSS